MTELPALRAMLSETAERRYPRRRRARRLLPATLAVAAIAAAIAFLFVIASPDRELEAVATPTPAAPAPTFAVPTPEPTVPALTPEPTVPAPTSTAPAPSTRPSQESNTRVKPLDVADIRDTQAVRDDTASGGELVRAWKVPALRGDVHLIKKPDGWCISVPDPLTDQPNLERGKTCTDSATFQQRGIGIGIGSTSVTVGPEADAPLVVTKAP